MKEKVKGLLRKAEVKGAMLASAAAAAMTGLAGAEDATSATVTAAFETGFQGMATSALNMIAAIVPIALSVAAVVFLAKKAMGWFKSLAK